MSPQLEIALVSATSALLGSSIGGLISFLSTHYAAKKKFEHDLVLRELEKRELLYADFMAETGKIILASLDKKKEAASDFVALFSLAGRIRIAASKEVADAATDFANLVVDTPERSEAGKIATHSAQVKVARDLFTNLCQKDLLEIRKGA